MSTTNDVQTLIGVMNFERGYPTAETARKLFDELDYQRAVQAYLWGYPAVSFESIRIATKRDFNGELNDMFIADKFADAQSLRPAGATARLGLALHARGRHCRISGVHADGPV